MSLSRVIAMFSVLVAVDAGAQWLTLPTPGVPRLPDGKPDLTAPAPRTPDGKPDFSGLWRNDGGDRQYNNITVDLEPGDVAPWADALYRKRRLEFGKDSMETQCLPLGPTYLMSPYREIRIVQTPSLVVFLFDDGRHRDIFMDGRMLEEDPNPSWLGYSVGRWEGDVLVVESNGYNELTWLDWDGHPHTEALRITERYTRRDIGHIENQVTMVDPAAYLKPITFSMPMKLTTDTEMLEYFCDNSFSGARISGGAGGQAVDVPVATLAGYVGVYDLVDEKDATNKTTAAITLSGDALFLDYNGKGKEELIAVGTSSFSWSGSHLEFSSSAGTPTLTIHYAEGSEGGPRRP